MFNTTYAYRLFSMMIVLTVTTIAAIGCLGNITDAESNLQFVRHVFSMDTTYNSPNIMWRAITAPSIHMVGFISIIIIEATLTFCGFFGLFKLAKQFRADERTFDDSKTFALIAMALAVLVWGFIFQAAGGEWFASWQSEHWNGLRDATRIVMMAMFGGLSLKLAK
ncbi:DUF2165 domain-containing protein [Ferrimonas sediminicola]|uniref:DUF2165 domain-containing protein n=1 Tax=Ferrimonas sediminicola TaxID=2569538 RepID=A0A4U1BJB0_9GAMM|nr:DUF2165 domain-containing protein [Ferrimonas sediminicola]TKB51463.1 DUF2165 domain-containing protein [Ferrimonas sediminicola]